MAWGELGAFEAVAEVEVEEGAVAVGEAGGGVPDQLAQVGPLGRLLGAGGGVGQVGHLLLGGLAGAGPDPAEGLAAGDRVQPGAEALGVAELAEALGRDQERVLGGVGGLVPVAQQAPAEVVQAVGVAVVDRGEGATVAGRRRPHQLGVVAPVGSRRSSVHSPPAIGPGPGRSDL
jgi:hypothetical protein